MAAGPNKHRVSPSGKTAARRYTVTLAPGNVAANATAESTASLAGISTSDVIDVNPVAALPAGLGISAVRVVQAGVIGVLFGNCTTAQVAGGTNVQLRVCVNKFSN